MNNSKAQARLLKCSLRQLDMNAWRESMLGVLSLEGFIAAAASSLSPKGPGGCDHNLLERCANCVTSTPYMLCGVHTVRARRTSAGRLWGCSLLGVGASSCAFHASSGQLRPSCRRLDYWGISVASSLMLRGVYPKVPMLLTALSIAATPFRPFLVSSLNTSAMELKYMWRAQRNPRLRGPYRLHGAACLLGLGCFILDEVEPKIPLMHACWHCLSATATGTINNLMADVEENELGLASCLTPLTL